MLARTNSMTTKVKVTITPNAVYVSCTGSVKIYKIFL